MNRGIIIFLVFCVFFVMPVLAAAQTDIPSSSRSREAIDRVKPDLEKELERKDLKYGDPIYIRIFKEEKELEVWIKKENGFDLFKKYDVCTYGSGTLGPKIEEGDGQAPEGFYYVTPDRLNPVSNFHLSFDIGYPNKYDRSQKRTGCDIMVHGSCVSIGCFAMTDKNIEEIFALVDAAFRNGQSFFRIHIFPFRMTKENMENYKDSEWYSFWGNLKEGYDFFEKNGKTPPNVEVSEGRYVFNLNNACFS